MTVLPYWGRIPREFWRPVRLVRKVGEDEFGERWMVEELNGGTRWEAWINPGTVRTDEVPF